MSGDSDHIERLQREAHDWLACFLRGNATPADLEAMKAWHARSPAHAEAYAQARRLWTSLGQVIGPAEASASAKNVGPACSSEAQSVPPRQPRRRSVSRRAVLGGSMAAGVATACGFGLLRPPFDLWPSLAQLSADFRTATGEQRTISITDNVSLDLNTQTAIAIRSTDANARHIELISGEALISVADPSRSLIVSVAAGRAIADDARFNLRYVENAACAITCLGGTVQVENGAGSVSLGAGQQVSFGSSHLGAVTAVDQDVVTAWQKGMLIFEFTPLAQVVEEINRYRPGRLVLLNEKLGHRVLNARLEIKDVDKVVGQIVRIFGAKATFLPAGLVVLT
jgi:transmembrane sensor